MLPNQFHTFLWNHLSIGAVPKFECENAAKLVNGKLIGVDFMPAKNREKEQPYILEVNASPGFAGIQNTVKSKNVLKDILKHFMNRDNWT